MNTNLLARSMQVILCGALLVTTLIGCASWNAGNREPLLSAAGFRERTPQTARQRELYAQAPAYHVQHLNAKGQSIYIYKDERKGVVWVGGPKEYQRYQQLALRQQIANENYEAAEMNQPMAWGWYSAWGPWAPWGQWGAGPYF